MTVSSVSMEINRCGVTPPPGVVYCGTTEPSALALRGPRINPTTHAVELATNSRLLKLKLRRLYAVELGSGETAVSIGKTSWNSDNAAVR
ncbi:MAG: hypothetical protein AAFS10_00610 [Myxococcota bacterium]